MNEKKSLRQNLIFAAVLLALAAALLLWRAFRNGRNQARGAALYAELIYGDNSTVQAIALDKDATYDVDTGYYTIHLKVKDGAICFVDSPCPDHVCEHYGWISQEDQSATCMPALATVIIVAKP